MEWASNDEVLATDTNEMALIMNPENLVTLLKVFTCLDKIASLNITQEPEDVTRTRRGKKENNGTS